MKIGITLWNLRARNIRQKIQRVTNLGFNSVSFLGSSFEKENTIEVAKIIKENNLTVTFHLGFFATNKGKLIEGLNERLKSISDFIKRGNIEENVGAICFDPAFKEIKNSKKLKFDLNSTIKALRYTLKRFKKIKIGIENWLINSRISDMKKIKKAISNKRLGVLLDIGHLHIALEQNLTDRNNLADYLKDLPFKIIEFHFHDNNGKVDLHLPLKRGNININYVLNSIKRYCSINEETVYTLEIRPNLKRPIPINDKKTGEILRENRRILMRGLRKE